MLRGGGEEEEEGGEEESVWRKSAKKKKKEASTAGEGKSAKHLTEPTSGQRRSSLHAGMNSARGSSAALDGNKSK